MPTFAVASVVPQHGAFFDRAERLKQQPHVILVLLFVQHPDKQLPIFYNPKHQPHTAVLTTSTVNERNRVSADSDRIWRLSPSSVHQTWNWVTFCDPATQ